MAYFFGPPCIYTAGVRILRRIRAIDGFAPSLDRTALLAPPSAQLGYTVPFTLVHAGKYRTEDKLKCRQYTN